MPPPAPPRRQVLRMPPYSFSTQQPADVFSTDPIRTLRAARFAAGFDLVVDQGTTKREICKHAHRCKFDSPGGGGGTGGHCGQHGEGFWKGKWQMLGGCK